MNLLLRNYLHYNLYDQVSSCKTQSSLIWRGGRLDSLSCGTDMLPTLSKEFSHPAHPL